MELPRGFRCLALTAERNAGTLFLTWLSPAPQAFLIFGHAAAMGIKFAILVAAMVLLSWAIFQFPLALEMLPLLLVLVMGLAAGAAFGLIVAAVVVRHRHSALLTNSLIGALAFMVGISYPVDVLPIWIQKLALIVPATWVVRGARASLVFGDSSDALISGGRAPGLDSCIRGCWDLAISQARSARRAPVACWRHIDDGEKGGTAGYRRSVGLFFA